MEEVGSLISYLADCYRENGSRSGVLALDSARVRRHVFLEGEDPLLAGAVLEGRFFVPGSEAAALAEEARIHYRDRELYLGSVFLVGRVVERDGRQGKAFAPLLWHVAEVAEVFGEDGAEFRVDADRRLLNYALLDCLGDEELLEAAEAIAGEGAPGEAMVGEFGRRLKEAVPDLEIGEMLSYPKLLSKKELSRISRATSRNQSLHLLPGAALFSTDKSTEMRGVLNDLEAMAAPGARLSGAVCELLGRPDLAKIKTGPLADAGEGQVPACLSAAQERILALARASPLTLAVGPPGTGKSFTIAALAIEAMSRGESVLVVSRMDHAVDVVADKVEESLGMAGLCVRVGQRDYRKKLLAFVDQLLAGMHSHPVSDREMKESRKLLRQLLAEVRSTEAALEARGRREERRGRLLSLPDPGPLARWRQSRELRRAATRPLAARLASRVGELLDQRIDRVLRHLEKNRRYRLTRALEEHRPSFQSFSRALRARSSHKRTEYFEGVAWQGVLGALPVWLANLRDLHRALPDWPGLFDLVIVDEASQCDIASALPALQRARRAVISGDPKQLRHLSFLPIARQAELAKRRGLSEKEAERYDYRHVSLVDLASAVIEDQNRVVFLDEHFRSRPPIIQFSNEAFYGGRLAVMTGQRAADRADCPALVLREVGGRRDGAGVNETEVEGIVAEILELAGRGGAPPSIGVLSPFRAQVDALMRRLEGLPEAASLFERHRIIVGTAHAFQGEERDIVFLSFALDGDSPAASFRFLEQENLFNVAVTRARFENRVFASFDPARRRDRLSGRYLESLRASATQAAESAEPVREPGDPLPGLVSALEDRGIELEEGFILGSYSLDLLCRRGETVLGIDLIGFPGPHGEAMSLERHYLFRRAGIRLFPLALSEWLGARERLLEEIEAWLPGQSSGGPPPLPMRSGGAPPPLPKQQG